MINHKFLSLFLLLLCSLKAQDINSSIQDLNTSEEKSYIDEFHERASQKVKHWSGQADDQLLNMADYLDNNEVNLSEPQTSVTEDNKNAVDSFFINDKYLDETDQSYVSIRPDARFNSKEDEEFNLKVSAHLALSKSQKRFKLFINELDPDNANNIATDNSEKEKTAPEIGLNYFAPEKYGIESKYSVGIRGIYPFVRARYSIDFRPGKWLIEPIQTFKYSHKDYFEEETQVFFDTKITDLSLFRIYLSRGTRSSVPGMSYDGSISMFWTPIKETGLSLSQGFNGSTKYQHTQDPNAIPIIYEDYNGIYNYATSLSLRQNFYRKWLFYEVQPGVNFHKLYDYEANYSIRIFFDIFFGKI